MPEHEIWKLKLTNGGIEVGRRETTHFDEGDPSVRSWVEPFNQAPHADMIELFRSLGKYALEIYRLDPKTAKDVQVTGFSVKDWADDNKATVFLHGKYRAMDDQMIPMPAIGLNIAATAYKNKTSLNQWINDLIEEAKLYIYQNKVEAPWTLFSQPIREMKLVGDENPNEEPVAEAV